MAKVSRPFSLDEYALIIEQAAKSDDSKPALKVLCLAQRSLVPFCQKHIFSSIAIPYLSPKVDTFSDILRASPHLLGHVKTFRYELEDDTTHLPKPVRARRDANATQLIERLPNLQHLSIVGPHEVLVDWEAISPQVADALLRLTHSRGLHSLHLEKIRQFPRNGLLWLRNSPNLRSLSFSAFQVFDNGLSIAGPIPFAQLSKFSLYKRSSDAVAVLLVGLSNIDARLSNLGPLSRISRFPQLQEIYAEWGDNKDMVASHWLIANATHLEHLSYVLPDIKHVTFGGLALAITKGPLQTLRSLKLYTSRFHKHDRDSFIGSIQELKQLAGGKMAKLEHIQMTFRFFINNFTYHQQILSTAINVGCESFDQIFCDDNSFPALRSISIQFVIVAMYDLEYGPGELLKQQFDENIQRIREQSFKNVDSISLIDFSFRWEIELVEYVETV